MASGPPIGARPASGSGQSHLGALIILTSLFFMWGFLTCLNDTIIPHLKAVFTLNYFQAMLVQFCFFMAYFMVSLPAGGLVERIGYKNGILAGLGTAALGCLMFYPSAGMRSYPMFLAALFTLAAGITVLQVSANPYVAVLGPSESASSRLTMTQAFNSLGTTIAPYFGALFILSHAVKSPEELAGLAGEQLEAYRATEAASVQTPYLGLALALLAVAVMIAMTKLPPIESLIEKREEGPSQSVWGQRHLVLGALGIFLYVGGEVAIGSFMVSYLQHLMQFSEASAAKLLTYYWGGAMVGRFLGAITTRVWPARRVLTIHAVVAGALVCASMFTQGQLAMVTILAVGFFNSIMFPTIFTLAIDGLGEQTGQGSGVLCMAIVGGALVPVAQGALADRIGIQLAFVLPVGCYAYIAWYGLFGTRSGGFSARPPA